VGCAGRFCAIKERSEEKDADGIEGNFYTQRRFEARDQEFCQGFFLQNDHSQGFTGRPENRWQWRHREIFGPQWQFAHRREVQPPFPPATWTKGPNQRSR
jgi:hypothetical protein